MCVETKSQAVSADLGDESVRETWSLRAAVCFSCTRGVFTREPLKKTSLVSPPRRPLSEVPVVHLQVAEPRLQAGQAGRRVLRLRAVVAGDGRHRPQQLGQRLRRPPLDLRGRGITVSLIHSLREYLKGNKLVLFTISLL